MTTQAPPPISRETGAAAVYSLYEQPFELREHAFNNGQCYLQKWAIRQRLTAIDPAWRETRPVIAFEDEDVVSATMSIIVNGVERFGTGAAIIKRWSKEGKEFTGYNLARAKLQAIKTAASDALTRAAYEFNIGWYLKLPEAKDLGAPARLEHLINVVAPRALGLLHGSAGQRQPDKAPDKAPERPPEVDPQGEVHRQPGWYLEHRDAFLASLHKGLGGDAATVERRALELLGVPDWSDFATGKAAADTIAAALKPANPRQPPAPSASAPTEDDESADALDPVVTACDAYAMNGEQMLKILGKDSWSAFKSDAQAVAAIHAAADAQQLPFVVGRLTYARWSEDKAGNYIDFHAPGKIGKVRMAGGRNKLTGMIGTYGKTFAEQFGLEGWEAGQDYQVEGLRVSWQVVTDDKKRKHKQVIWVSWEPGRESGDSDALFDAIPGLDAAMA